MARQAGNNGGCLHPSSANEGFETMIEFEMEETYHKTLSSKVVKCKKKSVQGLSHSRAVKIKSHSSQIQGLSNSKVLKFKGLQNHKVVSAFFQVCYCSLSQG